MQGKFWLPVVIALAAGFGVGVFAGPKLLPSKPDTNLYDLSALPEELREQHRDQSYLDREVQIFEASKEAMAKFNARMAARVPLELPDGMTSVPLGAMFEPHSGAHWPEGVDGDLSAALEAAKDGWVVLNF